MAEPNLKLPEVDVEDMDEDEALRYAIALSLQEQGQPAARETPAAASTFGTLALDRKKMEEERLRRLAKRPRSSSDDDVVEVPPPKRRVQPGASSPAKAVPFPNGTVKRTWANGYPRTNDDIKIDEVLQKDQLQLAVLSSFQWDDEWIMSKLDLQRTKLILAAFAADESQKQAMRANAPPGIRFCFPPMNGPGSMHSKLQLLKYADYLRIAIPTGNLVPYDWGETGVMENMVFLIDLPRLPASMQHRPTAFSTELGRFLRAMGVEESMAASLEKYDFSPTAELGFVYSIPGGHTDESLKRIGYCGLGATVASLGLATTDPIEVDFVCASLGSLNYEFVGALYNACQGDDGMAEYKERSSRTTKGKLSNPSHALKDRFRIYFPKEATVVESRGGRSAGGTICVQANWWRSSSFPRELMIFVRKSATGGSNAGQQSPGWAYIGSANLSESAWGRLVKERGTGKAKLNCRNWECGVVVPVMPVAKETTEPGGMSIFHDTVPVPMQVPGPKYGPKEEPWFFLRP